MSMRGDSRDDFIEDPQSLDEDRVDPSEHSEETAEENTSERSADGP